MGIDRSAPLIDAARNYSGNSDLIRYQVADVTTLAINDKLAARSMDAVTLIMAAQNLSPLSAVWRFVHELLIPNGALIVVMMHPCFRIPQQSDWVWDQERGKQSRRIDSYLTSTQIGIETHPSQAVHGKSPQTTHHHRPLQAYVNTLGNAGLLIDRIEEWTSHKTSQPGRKQMELDRSRKEIPLFLALRAIKTAPLRDLVAYLTPLDGTQKGDDGH
jgi:hypothetical protein